MKLLNLLRSLCKLVFNDYRIESIKRVARKNNSKLWNDLLKKLKHNHEINIGKLSKLTKNGDVVAIPGKVLGGGIIEHSLTIGAVDFSQTAKEKIHNAGGKTLLIEKLVEANPEGKGVKIFIA